MAVYSILVQGTAFYYIFPEVRFSFNFLGDNTKSRNSAS